MAAGLKNKMGCCFRDAVWIYQYPSLRNIFDRWQWELKYHLKMYPNP